MSPKPAVTALRQPHPDESIMALTVGTEGTATVITVRGELDMSSTPLVAEMVEHVLRRRSTRVVMDLSGVTFFSAHGISMVLHVRSVTARANVDFTMRAPAPCVTYLLAVTGVLSHLDGGPAEPSPVPISHLAARNGTVRRQSSRLAR